MAQSTPRAPSDQPLKPTTVRRSKIQHSFGTNEAQLGPIHVLMRRLRHVKTKSARNVPAYTVQRMVALTVVGGLLVAVKA